MTFNTSITLSALLPLLAGCSAARTGTDFDHTLAGFTLGAASWVYWALALSALAFALLRPKKAWAKALAATLVVAAFGYLPAKLGHADHQAYLRLTKATAMFNERCRTAGEKIHRTADNVEGVLLMKVRPDEINDGDQFRMDDPYGRDLGRDGYVGTFVRGKYQAETRGPSAPGSPPRLGYLWVEAVDPKNGKRYRYTGGMKVVGHKDASAPNVQVELQKDPNYDLNIYAFILGKVPAPGPAPRYGVTYDDISTREEREYWIAGSSLKVIDLQTNELMAERIGYMMDRGQGNDSGGRAPWLMAADNACPSFQRNPLLPLPPGQGAAAQRHQAQDFVEKVLKPKLEK